MDGTEDVVTRFDDSLLDRGRQLAPGMPLPWVGHRRWCQTASQIAYSRPIEGISLALVFSVCLIFLLVCILVECALQHRSFGQKERTIKGPSRRASPQSTSIVRSGALSTGSIVPDSSSPLSVASLPASCHLTSRQRVQTRVCNGNQTSGQY